MKKLKYFAVYCGGYILFLCVLYKAFGIDSMGGWTQAAWCGTAYFIANIAGDIERTWRTRDSK